MTVEQAVTAEGPHAPTAPGRPARSSPWWWRRSTSSLVAGGLYLLLSVGLWWQAWSRGPSSFMTCGCTDAGRMVWYFRWSSFALAHGHNPLFSTWLFHPSGLNLLTDTSVPAIALVMSPLTLLFGPVFGVNAAATLIPALTALSMFWLLRRWVQWTPAAFVGGLAYGFSSFVIVQLAFGWLNLACLALLPLMVGCLDELLVRQRTPPVRTGVFLALLVGVEFFISTEVLLISAVSGLVAMVLLVGYALRRSPADLGRRAGHASIGLGAAFGLSAVLLAYPVWLFVAGPGHLGTLVWSTNVPGNLGNSLSNFWSRIGLFGPVSTQALAREANALGGYRGPATPSPSYLGLGMLAVLAIGVLIWRRDRRLWLFGALAVVTAALSLRVGGDRWGPWSLVYHLSLFQNVVQYRFSAVVGLCVAVLLSVIVDRSRTELLHRTARSPGRADPDGQPSPPDRARLWAAALVPLAVAALALGPEVAVLAPNLPVVMQPVSVPEWFADTAAHLPGGQVVLTYPFATADSQASIPWQAIDGMRYQMAGGGGPAGTVAHAGAETAGFSVLRDASVPLLPPPAMSEENLVAVRRAVTAWGVTTVVVPDDTGLPIDETARGTTYGVAFFSSVLGTAPAHQDGAWVWSIRGRSSPSVPLSDPAFAQCVGDGAPGSPTPAQAAGCVLGGPAPGEPRGR